MTIKNKQIHKYYFDHPEIWNSLRENNIDGESNIDNEIAFLHEIFSKNKLKNLIDIGSGTGFHVQKLSELNYNVIGLDLNKKMIEYSKKKYKHLDFLYKDMRNLKGDIPLKNKFDGLFSFCTTFPYNKTNDEVDAALQGFYYILKKNGLAIIETYNPILFLQKKHFSKSYFLDNRGKSSFGSVIFKETHIIDEQRQVLIEKGLVLNKKTNKIIKEEETVFRLFFPQEIQYMLSKNGFKVLGQFGKYDTKYDKLDTVRMITVAQKI